MDYLDFYDPLKNVYLFFAWEFIGSLVFVS